MRYMILVVLLAYVLPMPAQGTVKVQTSPTITQLVEQFISENKAENAIKGWRIQIITTNDRRKMEAAKSKFSSLYPDVDLKWNHVAPYYRVKVGAYENKMQLMGFLLELKKEFPGVIPVMDDVKKSELIGY